ncbi:MAG TPA: hypothetical protein VFC56_09795 [Stellaceae bacterium]|nr:hypothetical protein [Stellaceae bacterium]
MIWKFFIVCVLAYVGYLLYSFFFRKVGRFWRIAGSNPDLAIALLKNEPHCLVDTAPVTADRRDYTGPFSLMDRAGQKHTIYILFAEVDEIQNRVARQLTRGAAP